MSKKALTGLFFVALILDLVCVQLELHNWRYITKPLLVLLLINYFITRVQSVDTRLKWWMAGALFFSWLGDVLLLFEAQNARFFILGLSSFLVAHICYCWFFNRVRQQEGLAVNLLFFLFIIIYYIALIRLLTPRLGDMKLPVWAYGVVICGMLWLALHLHKVYWHNAGLFMLLGALLFVLSDSVLAVNRFYQPFSWAGISIMLTYGLAQWLITEGSVRWLLASHTAKTVNAMTANDSQPL